MYGVYMSMSIYIYIYIYRRHEEALVDFRINEGVIYLHMRCCVAYTDFICPKYRCMIRRKSLNLEWLVNLHLQADYRSMTNFWDGVMEVYPIRTGKRMGKEVTIQTKMFEHLLPSGKNLKCLLTNKRLPVVFLTTQLSGRFTVTVDLDA